MRDIWCGPCGKDKQPGRRIGIEADGYAPAEWERVVRGPAKPSTREQRTLGVVSTAGVEKVELATLVCDKCNRPIKPGDEIVCYTAWVDGRPEPGPWEPEYVERAR